MKKITLLIGNYGSGKTEISLNLALKAREEHGEVSLVDFDIVNPYFRSSEHKAMLEEKGVRVIAPWYANTGVDLPVMPPEVYSAFKGGYAVFDCGGDAVGATALGGIHEHIMKARGDMEALFVVNTNRPFQDSVQRIKESLERVQESARIQADGFILNTNLGAETTGAMLAQGLDIITEAVRLTGTPLKAVCGTRETLAEFRKLKPEYKGEALEIKIFMRPEWMAID